MLLRFTILFRMLDLGNCLSNRIKNPFPVLAVTIIFKGGLNHKNSRLAFFFWLWLASGSGFSYFSINVCQLLSRASRHGALAALNSFSVLEIVLLFIDLVLSCWTFRG
jgi:hypothetical protein